MIQIGNDGNLLPAPVTLTAARRAGHRRALRHRHRLLALRDRRQGWIWSTCASTRTARGRSRILSLAEALSGSRDDPCVGRFLEFRIVRNPPMPDMSQVPATLIPNPDLSNIPVARERVFEFGRGGKQTTLDRSTASAARGASRPTAATC